VDVTDLERTLIDIVVRPAYAGGIKLIADAYKHAFKKIDVEYLTKLLQKMEYAYPYHQSIGFLLERAGATEQDCRRLSNLGTEFDFYLDYKMKNPAYSKKWRLYYPPLLH
jgi:predicted transcriptional regulator of viral defense system